MTNHSFDNQMSPETYLCHGPFDPEVFGGVVNPPVYHASTVIFKNCKELNERHQALFEDAEDEVMYYGRFGTPITFAVQKALAELEGGYRSLLVPTGLAACTSALLALVKSGDHILVSSSVYGPTRGFVNNVLAKMGVSATFFDPTIGDGIGQLFQENTTVVFTESPGSQTFDIQDIPAITRVAHAHNAKVIIDNTWATPLFFKPFEHGVDVSVHAATKYIVGHSDAQMGLITTNKETWLAIRRFIYLFGLHAAPDDVYLAQRGLRTMSLRLGRHQDSALKIAMLQDRADVAIVDETEQTDLVRYSSLFKYEMVAILANEHPLTRKPWLEAEDFRGESLITYAVPDERIDLCRKVLKPAGIPIRRKTTELTMAIIQQVACQRGIAALPIWAVSEYLEKKYVTAKSITENKLISEVWLATLTENIDKGYVNDFIGFTRQRCLRLLDEI